MRQKVALTMTPMIQNLFCGPDNTPNKMVLKVYANPCLCYNTLYKITYYEGDKTLDSKTVAKLIVEAAEDKKAGDIRLLDVEALTTLADYFIICEGNSDRQIRAITEGIRAELKDQGVQVFHQEGTPESGWVLLDYGDVLAHVFSPDKRAFYQLESLWQEAPTVLRML